MGHSTRGGNDAKDTEHELEMQDKRELILPPCFLTCGLINICETPDLIETFGFYFPCLDTDYFVQCDESKECFVQQCPPGQFWNAFIRSCVHAPPDGGTCSGCKGPLNVLGNACVFNPGGYLPCPEDDNKYIQCDNFGGCFERDCPAGLVWDVSSNTCNWP